MKHLKYFIFLLFLFNLNFSSASDEHLKSKITKNLRCLICQGQSVYDSQTDFAISMKLVIIIMRFRY